MTQVIVLPMHPSQMSLEQKVRVARKVLGQMARDLDQSLADPLTVGSDCEGIITRSHQRRARAFLGTLGLTREQLEAALEQYVPLEAPHQPPDWMPQAQAPAGCPLAAPPAYDDLSLLDYLLGSR